MKKERKVVIDVETTGTDIVGIDRIISIGMVELIDNIPTNKFYYQEFNPSQVLITNDNFNIHGLSNEFLKSKPRFQREHAQEILNFISDSDLIIHNAQFDTLFLRKEFKLLGIPDILNSNKVICTVELSRNILPIFHVGLDKVASYFGLRTTRKDKFHNALDDARLLAEVYYLLSNKQKKTKGRSLWNTFNIDHEVGGTKQNSYRRRINIDFNEFLNLMKSVNNDTED